MVEDIDGLYSKQQRPGFRERKILGDRHVVVLGAWTIEEPLPRGAGVAQRIQAEGARIEEFVPIRSWILTEVNRAAVVIRLIDARVVHALRIGSNERIVPVMKVLGTGLKVIKTSCRNKSGSSAQSGASSCFPSSSRNAI